MGESNVQQEVHDRWEKKRDAMGQNLLKINNFIKFSVYKVQPVGC